MKFSLTKDTEMEKDRKRIFTIKIGGRHVSVSGNMATKIFVYFDVNFYMVWMQVTS